MAKRKRMGRKASRKLFKRTASRTKPINFNASRRRGGIRL